MVSWLADALEVSPREAPRDRDPRTRGGGHKRCSNARLKEAGFRCLYPSFREGYGEMLAGLRAD